MSGHQFKGLAPNQETAIIELINQPSVKKAAEAVGVTERTLYRWLDEPAFSAAYKKMRRESFRQAMGLTQRYAPMAVTTLAQIVSDKAAPHSARVSAASALLKFSRESLELDDLAERISVLEHGSKPSSTPPPALPPAPEPPPPEPTLIPDAAPTTEERRDAA